MTNGPEFQKRHLKTSEKTAKKNAALERAVPADGEALPPAPQKKVKKVYTPFPPPQQPSKLDLAMASGEYFLKPRERESAEKRRREENQVQRAEEKRVEREEAFVAPPEEVRAAVGGAEKKKKRKRDKGDVVAEPGSVREGAGEVDKIKKVKRKTAEDLM